jgi:hypothetical protein
MTSKRLMMACGLALVAAIGLGHAVNGASSASPGQAQGRRAAYPYGVAEICRDLDRYEALKIAVPVLLRLTAEQKNSWAALNAALAQGRTSLDAGCARLNGIPASGSAPSQAARLEVVLSSSLDALHRVRPAFDRFYATLDDGQRRQVDTLFDNYRI